MQVAHRHHAGPPDVIRRRADGRMLDGLDDRVRNRTTVETLGAQMSDPLVRLGERGVREHRAHVARRSVCVEEQRGAGRNIVEPVAVRVRLVEPHLVNDIAVTRDVNRRREDLRQRHRPELLERVDPCLDRAGNSDGEPAVPRIVERQGAHRSPRTTSDAWPPLRSHDHRSSSRRRLRYGGPETRPRRFRTRTAR